MINKIPVMKTSIDPTIWITKWKDMSLNELDDEYQSLLEKSSMIRGDLGVQLLDVLTLLDSYRRGKSDN